MISQSIANIAQQLGAQLNAKGWTVSCAESCTGGGVAFALTSVAGSSAWFERSFVTYSNQAKSELLMVDNDTLERWGAVSQQTVLEMANGCADKANANLAISVSGIAGPNGGTVDKPVGLVWFGFYLNGQSSSCHQVFKGNRETVRLQAIEFVLSRALSLVN